MVLNAAGESFASTVSRALRGSRWEGEEQCYD